MAISGVFILNTGNAFSAPSAADCANINTKNLKAAWEKKNPGQESTEYTQNELPSELVETCNKHSLCIFVPSQYNAKGKEIGGDACSSKNMVRTPFEVNVKELATKWPKLYKFEATAENGNNLKKPNPMEGCALVSGTNKCELYS